MGGVAETVVEAGESATAGSGAGAAVTGGEAARGQEPEAARSGEPESAMQCGDVDPDDPLKLSIVVQFLKNAMMEDAGEVNENEGEAMEDAGEEKDIEDEDMWVDAP